jgi:hypothetical protein
VRVGTPITPFVRLVPRHFLRHTKAPDQAAADLLFLVGQKHLLANITQPTHKRAHIGQHHRAPPTLDRRRDTQPSDSGNAFELRVKRPFFSRIKQPLPQILREGFLVGFPMAQRPVVNTIGCHQDSKRRVRRVAIETYFA